MTKLSGLPITIIDVDELERECKRYMGRDVTGSIYYFGDDVVSEITASTMDASAITVTPHYFLPEEDILNSYKIGDVVEVDFEGLTLRIDEFTTDPYGDTIITGVDVDHPREAYTFEAKHIIGKVSEPLSEPITEESLNFTPTDTVNHPPHYNFGDIEVIDYIKQVTETYDGGFTAYCIGNVLKYVSRAQHKGNPAEDLRKAEWYLRKAVENEAE